MAAIIVLCAVALIVAVGVFAWRDLAEWLSGMQPSVPSQQTAAQPSANAAGPVAAPPADPNPRAVQPQGRAATTPRESAASGRATSAPARPAGPVGDDSRTKPSIGTEEDARELAAAKAKMDAREFSKAESDLKQYLARRPGSALAPEAMYLVGQAQELDGHGDTAAATYTEFRTRYKGHARMPDVTFRLAQLTLAMKGRESDAIKLFTDLVAQYPNSPRAPEALFAKAGIQDRVKLRETDPKSSASVPASLLTYRVLADRYPRAVLTEHALFRIGNMYDELKRYDLAAQAFERLAETFPQSRYDGWFRAGELYERRLNNADKARSAYAKVPSSSSRYRDAQKRAGK